MKRSLRKITYREIRRSFGRFLSILCIVLLGAGFLYGLRVTEGDMIRTLDQYADENKFFDYKIVSTLGLTADDVADFAAMDGVEAAEGTVSTDAIFNMTDGEARVVKVHSIPQRINVLKLREGRMPQADNECVVDALFAADNVLGKTITMTDNNEADTLGMFTYKTYRVVGLVNSPLYINFSRGTTTLGNGTVKGFVYVLPAAFDVDYYTEAYVRLEKTGGVYTDEYAAAINAFRDTMETEAKARAELRYQQVLAKANGQYNSAVSKYNSGVADYQAQKAAAEKQLAESLAQLDAAEAALPAARAQLDGGWAQLNDGQGELNQKWAAYQTQTADSRAQLESAKAQLDTQWAAYNQALAQYNKNVAQYGELLFLVQKAQLDATKTQLDAAQAQYDAGAAELAAADRQFSDAQAQIDAKRAELEQGEARYAAAVEQIREGRAQYAAAKTKADTQFSNAQMQLSSGQASLVNAKVKLNGIEEPTVYVLDRSTNTGYASFKNDAGIVEGVARVFPLFFFLVSALVCVTTMNRMVDEQRTQIGTLKSLGYTSWEIMRGYLAYTGLASGLGSILGVAVGGVVFPKIIWMGYNIMYGFTGIAIGVDWGFAAVVCGAFLVCSLGVTWLSCRSELRQVPAELIRPRTPRAGKRILLEKIPFLWNRFSFLRKVSARNIFRYKKRMFMMIVGIAGCTALLLTAFGLNDSITGLADTQFSEISVYDAQVSFRAPMSKADQQAFLDSCGGNVSNCAFLSMSSVSADVGGTPKNVYLVGTDEPDMSPFMHFTLNGQTQAYPGDGQVLINDNLARILKVGAGDTITLQGSDMHTLTLTVSGVFYNVLYNYAYVTMNTLRSAEGFGSDVNCAYLDFSGSDVYKSAAAVGASDYVMAVTVCKETQGLVSRSLESMTYIVGLVSFCAGALAFIVLYNLTNINITERIREIATIKVLGFRQWETAAYVYRENMVLTLMGTALGIPLGIWLHRYVMGNIRIDMVSYAVRILWPSFAIAVALTVLFAILVDFVMYFRLDRIDMAESLKSVE